MSFEEGGTGSANVLLLLMWSPPMQLFTFADRYRGSYSDALSSVVCPFYCSYSGYKVRKFLFLTVYWYTSPMHSEDIIALNCRMQKFVQLLTHIEYQYLCSIAIQGAPSLACTRSISTPNSLKISQLRKKVRWEHVLCCWDLQDELLWGATWLYKASRDAQYVRYIVNSGASLGGLNVTTSSLNWDNKYAGAQVLLSQVSTPKIAS